MAYEHTNSKGVTYYLHKSEVTLRGGPTTCTNPKLLCAVASPRRFTSSPRTPKAAKALRATCPLTAR